MTKENMEVYKEPLYYEIAFSFVDPEKQVDFFEKVSAETIKTLTYLFTLAAGIKLIFFP